MDQVDLNCDCGEGFGAYTLGDDAAMFEVVTSANVACGFHAGDPATMETTFTIAKQKNVAIGAHPGFADLAGFGRRRIPCTPKEIEQLVAYQIGAAQAMAAYSGHKITYVKTHGALGNMGTEDAGVARAIMQAVRAVDPDLAFLAIAKTQLEIQSREAGLRTVCEIYADRAYTDEALLVSRSLPGAVLHDPKEIADRVVAMVTEGAIITVSGKRIPTKIESICVHGDTPGAVTIAKTVRQALEQAGLAVRPFAPAA